MCTAIIIDGVLFTSLLIFNLFDLRLHFYLRYLCSLDNSTPTSEQRFTPQPNNVQFANHDQSYEPNSTPYERENSNQSYDGGIPNRGYEGGNPDRSYDRNPHFINEPDFEERPPRYNTLTGTHVPQNSNSPSGSNLNQAEDPYGTHRAPRDEHSYGTNNIPSGREEPYETPVPQEDPYGRHTVPHEDPNGRHTAPHEDPYGRHTAPQEDPYGRHTAPQEDPYGRHTAPQEDPYGSHTTPHVDSQQNFFPSTDINANDGTPFHTSNTTDGHPPADYTSGEQPPTERGYSPTSDSLNGGKTSAYSLCTQGRRMIYEHYQFNG